MFWPSTYDWPCLSEWGPERWGRTGTPIHSGPPVYWHGQLLRRRRWTGIERQVMPACSARASTGITQTNSTNTRTQTHSPNTGTETPRIKTKHKHIPVSKPETYLWHRMCAAANTHTRLYNRVLVRRSLTLSDSVCRWLPGKQYVCSQVVTTFTYTHTLISAGASLSLSVAQCPANTVM